MRKTKVEKSLMVNHKQESHNFVLIFSYHDCLHWLFFIFLDDVLSADSDDESLSSSSEGSSSSGSSSSSEEDEDEEEGERAESEGPDSMDESTMDSTTEKDNERYITCTAVIRII